MRAKHRTVPGPNTPTYPYLYTVYSQVPERVVSVSVRVAPMSYSDPGPEPLSTLAGNNQTGRGHWLASIRETHAMSPIREIKSPREA